MSLDLQPNLYHSLCFAFISLSSIIEPRATNSNVNSGKCLQMLLCDQRVITFISTHPVVCRQDSFCQSVRSPPALVKATNLSMVLYPVSRTKYNLRVQWDIAPSTSRLHTVIIVGTIWVLVHAAVMRNLSH